MTKEELVDLFRRVGASDPESWATSQAEEGIPQLHRFLFLRQAWRRIVADTDTSWIDSEIRDARAKPGAPCSGIGPALERVLGHGVDRQDITDIVRVKQYQLLFDLMYLLGDPQLEEPELETVAWGLFATDEDGQPIDAIDSLHESCLETDPTGREMRRRTGS